MGESIEREINVIESKDHPFIEEQTIREAWLALHKTITERANDTLMTADYSENETLNEKLYRALTEQLITMASVGKYTISQSASSCVNADKK